MPDAALTPLHPLARKRRHHVVVLVAASVALGAAACSPTSTESTTSSTTAASSTTADPGTPSTGESTYGSIADLHQAILDGGFACTLEYPGLKDDVTSTEVSICTIENENAFLKVWADPENLAEFISSPEGATGVVAVGGDWTISVTSADLAGRLAAALGGTAPDAG